MGKQLTNDQSQIVADNINLVRRIVAKLAHKNKHIQRHYDDCIQIGCLALADAVRNWKPKLGKLGTYAAIAIYRRVCAECPREESCNNGLWQQRAAASEPPTELCEFVHDILMSLPEKERKLIWAVHGLGIQKKALSAKFGLNYQQLSEILERATATLQETHGRRVREFDGIE